MPSRKKTDADASPATLEATIAEIETILARMKGEEQPLERSLKDFEAGITLTRRAQALLRDAEQQVQKLTENADGDPAAGPLDDDADA